MPTNSQFTVATHILTLLAMKDKPMSSRIISGSINTNPVVVRRIVGTLQAAELVQTQMGVDGGTVLARPAAEITLRDVYAATNQGGVLPMHSSPPNEKCGCGRNIQAVLAPIYARAQAAMEAELATTTVADLAAAIVDRLKAESEPG